MPITGISPPSGALASSSATMGGDMAARGRPKAELVLTEEERSVLERLMRRPKSAQALALRARIVLACASGQTNQTVADKMGVKSPRHRRRAGAVRQRLLLPGKALQRGPRRHQAPLLSALPTPDQWEGREVPPHPQGGVGVLPALLARVRPDPGPCAFPPYVQPSPAPHRHRGPPIFRVTNLPRKYI